jgi:hypothetical protein
MKRLNIWTAISVVAALGGPIDAMPRSLVQLYGDSHSTHFSGVVWYRAFLILPDGSHVSTYCFEAPDGEPCKIEPFAPEERARVPCEFLEPKTVEVTCYKSEWYGSEQKGNDVALYTGRGKVTYHIDGAW